MLFDSILARAMVRSHLHRSDREKTDTQNGSYPAAIAETDRVQER
ncbi:hypothetical protein KR51_00025630 [Rubidibacter lacunae KORDI 51-2]|uniref:Uncharacterized protein n=1 Tax=Rubidibacter lacunae KORDI 51-2 TaxID=582515 RepID=U5DJU9_9CHRO|nr:hypothetical protein [Rubidibacter lacunae]ERN40854.1 hypothetical protein KR51_00025630 [Rubidibacter lacunae KORDI 51-2]